MFAFVTALLPLLPRLIETGIATVDAFSKVKTLIDEDRSLTPDERADLEAKILEAQNRLHDTSRDVQE